MDLKDKEWKTGHWLIFFDEQVFTSLKTNSSSVGSP